MSPQQYLTRIALLMCVTLLLLSLPTLYADPFQVFHKTRFTGMGLSHLQRYANAGLINSYLADPAEGYDAVMIGSSLSENFTTRDAAALLKWQKPLRLFMDGSNAQEQAGVLAHALRTNQVQHVLWEFLSPAFAGLDVGEGQLPEYLYNSSALDDIHYLFNFDVLKRSWRIFTGNTAPYIFTTDNIGYWADNAAVVPQHAKFNAPEHLLVIEEDNKLRLTKPLLTGLNDAQVKLIDYTILESNIFPLLNAYCNTDIEFVLYVPPLSRMRFINLDTLNYNMIYLPRRVLQHIELCKNIRLHAFDLMNFTNDLNNYKDEQHYGLHISNLLLELIGKHEHVLTLHNVREYEAGFIRNINEYRPYTSYPAPVAPTP